MARGLKRVFLAGLIGLAGMVLLLFVAGVVVGYLSAHGAVDPRMALNVVMAVFAVAMMGGAMWLSVMWMRSIDEAAREAHKSAWFWGGSAGMTVGGVACMLAALEPAKTISIPVWFEGRSDPVAYAATGAFAMLTLMLIGYAVAWVWWWWSRRG